MPAELPTRALGLLAVVLDREKRFDEAGEIYRRAIALTPQSVSLLNNYGNHFAATGDARHARETFLKVIAINPAHVNANLQLATLAIDRNAPSEALLCLNRLPPGEQSDPAIALLRMRALYLAHRNAEADTILASLTSGGQQDPRLLFSTALALAASEQYTRAEEIFSRVLEHAPGDFDVLWNLGLAAFHAGHTARAQDVLETALRLRPDDVDVLYNLAVADNALKRGDAALPLLARAARLAPERKDVQRLLAQLAFELGYYADAFVAWERYRKLAPDDDVARREHGFIATILGRWDEGIADLQWFARKHPGDAMGQYELGMAETAVDREQAFQRFDKAVSIQPDLVQARYGRGLLHYEQGRFGLALADLEHAARLEPDSPVILDRLGQTYLALGRNADAIRVLEKAVAKAPGNATTLLHYGRALSNAGREAEARPVFERFCQIGPDRSRRRKAGLIDFLGLSPEEQRSRFRTAVETAVRENPKDSVAEVAYLKLLLNADEKEQADAVACQILALKPSAAILAGAGRALLDAGQYGTARQTLEQALASGSANAEIRLNLAIATFHTSGPQAALEQMDRLPEPQRTGDYYLARAEILDAAGQFNAAVQALNQALEAAPTRPELYRQAVFFLIKNQRIAEALHLLEQASRFLPDNPDLLLLRATTLELARKTSEAEHLLTEIQNRWPEWPNAWLAHGIILQTHKNYDEARRMIEIAVALGAQSAEAYYYLADTILRTAPERTDDARQAIQRAVDLAPTDPWVRALAGRIAFEKRDYATAVEQLREAIRLRPNLAQAHYNLAQTYSALARKDDAQKELEQLRQIHQQSPNADEEMPGLMNTLFQVEPASLRSAPNSIRRISYLRRFSFRALRDRRAKPNEFARKNAVRHIRMTASYDVDRKLYS